MKKKLSQFTDPAITYAAGRAVWVKSSVFKMFVTPPAWKEEEHDKPAAAAEGLKQNKLSVSLPGPKPKLRIKAKTQTMLM